MDVRKFAPYQGLFLAIAVAAVLQAWLVARSPSITADGIIFTAIAKQLAVDPIATFRTQDQHPGFPAALLAGASIVRSLGCQAEPECWMIAGQSIGFVCGLLSVAVVWLFARDLFDQRAANLAAFVFAVLPVPRANAADGVSDTPHLLFYLVAAWWASSAVASGRLLTLAAAGAASGIAYWIRPEGLEVALVAFACVIGRGLYAHWGWRRIGMAGTVLAGSTLAVVAPYWVLAGKFTSKQLQFAKVEPGPTYIETLAEVRPVQPQAQPAPPAANPAPEQPRAAATPDARSPVAASVPVVAPSPAPAVVPAANQRHYSLRLVARVMGKAITVLMESIFQGFKYVFIPFYLLGHLELFRRKPEWFSIGFVVLLGAMHIATLLGVFILSGYIAHRHALVLVALGMPVTGLGIVYAAERLAPLAHLRPGYLQWVTAVACAAMVLPYTLRPFCREFIPVIDATHWVETHARPGAGIVCNSPYAGFHGHLPVALLDHRAGNIADALRLAEKPARYDYAIIHVGAHAYRPEWLAELEPNYRQVQLFPDPGTGGRSKKVLVFEAKSEAARRAAAEAR